MNYRIVSFAVSGRNNIILWSNPNRESIFYINILCFHQISSDYQNVFQEFFENSLIHELTHLGISSFNIPQESYFSLYGEHNYDHRIRFILINYQPWIKP